MKRRNSNWSHVAVLAASLWSLNIGLAGAEEQKPDNEVSFNAAVTSDYRYRGISQSRLDPALQGGADYTHNPTGLYAGTWLSTIKWTKDLGGSGDVEWDLYGGKRGNLTSDITYDVGGLYYFYPSNGLHPNANTFELYGQLGSAAISRMTMMISSMVLMMFPDGSMPVQRGARAIGSTT